MLEITCASLKGDYHIRTSWVEQGHVTREISDVDDDY